MSEFYRCVVIQLLLSIGVIATVYAVKQEPFLQKTAMHLLSGWFYIASIYLARHWR